MSFLKQPNVALSVLLCVVLGVLINVSRANSSSAEAGPTQDVSSLDRRISLLEQRFYSLESSINRLQQVALSQRSIPQSSASDQELNLMREDLRRLALRLTEIECGLLKLDERTTMAARDARKSAPGKATDPCRANPDLPLRLSARP